MKNETRLSRNFKKNLSLLSFAFSSIDGCCVLLLVLLLIATCCWSVVGIEPTFFIVSAVG